MLQTRVWSIRSSSGWVRQPELVQVRIIWTRLDQTQTGPLWGPFWSGKLDFWSRKLDRIFFVG